MSHSRNIRIAAVILVLPLFVFAQTPDRIVTEQTTVYSFAMKTIDGKEQPLSEYRGNVLLVVNVASQCGYTPQYKDLQAVYEKYKDQGFRILAFPANNFGSQEPGTDEEIKEFCETNYHVSFDLFSKISVKGDDQHPLYRYLTLESPFPGEVKWNFQKYLVDRKGNIVAMFPSRVKPTDKEVERHLEALLNDKL